MIISHKNKYLFIELPRTGSTAISKELRENYDGERILRKHSFFHEFKKIATLEEKKYFVFSCVRNPLDDVVSIYFKFKTTDIKDYAEEKEHKKNASRRFKFIRNNNDYLSFLKKFYKIPYDNWSSLAHSHFDYVIRYESIQTDFSKVLDQIGLEQKRSLPVINKTNEKGHFLLYYTPETYAYAKYVFGPFMKRWGYELPSIFGDSRVPLSSEILFRFLGIIRKIYWKYLYGSSSIPAKFILKIFGR
ncbi:sulfotransferase family protein [bacterium]|nr:sulfotransferase family protein [bacterium]